jgi:hypothetical protein
MSWLYALPWAVWVLWFVAWEAFGFRKAHDHWPTLSQVVKGWMDRQLRLDGRWVTARSMPPFQHYRWARSVERGVVNWSWRRWLVAVGLPLLAAVLEMHWVWEWF